MHTKKFKIDWLFIAGFAVMGGLAIGAAYADTTTAVATSVAEAQAASGAVAAGNKTAVSVPIQFNNPPIPTQTGVDMKNVPSLGGMGGWAYAAPAGPCLGPSETKQGGAQAAWMGFGAGGQYGEGQSNLDWGCVLLREMAAADSRCKAGVKLACDDLAKLYEMQPGISAIRNGALPSYAQRQVVPKPPAPTAQPRADTGTMQTAAVQQPKNCVSDEYIARRMGAPVCK